MALDELRNKLNGGRARPRLVTPVFLLVMGSTLAYFVSVGVLIPTLPRYVKDGLGGGDLAVGLAIGSFAISAILLRPAIGHLGDLRGRRVLIMGGAAAVSVSVFGYVFTDSLLPLLALRLVSGAGEAAFYVGAASVINDLSPDERRGEALSYFSLALYSGLALGPLLGETVLHATGFSWTWIAAAISAAIAVLFGIRVPDTRPDHVGERRGGIIHRAGLLPGIVLATSIWGLSGFTTFVPLYALQLGLNGSRGVFALYSGIVLTIRSLGARIPDKLGPSRCAGYALTISSVGLG